MAYKPKLKPCPFCGGEATFKSTADPFPHGSVGCAKRKAYMGWVTDPRQTVAKWNRRVKREDLE